MSAPRTWLCTGLGTTRCCLGGRHPPGARVVTRIQYTDRLAKCLWGSNIQLGREGRLGGKGAGTRGGPSTPGRPFHRVC